MPASTERQGSPSEIVLVKHFNRQNTGSVFHDHMGRQLFLTHFLGADLRHHQRVACAAETFCKRRDKESAEMII